MSEPTKVTDPLKITTDPVLLSALKKQGIDKDYVEFWHDYAPRSLGKEYSPYAKFYRDLKSGKRIMVASGLPMVKALGHKIEVGWLYAKGKYYSKANLFSAIVEGNQVNFTCLSDQPDGTKKDDELSFHPQLFIGGVEVKPLSDIPKLLETDPVNENYNNNTLEWNYGVCLRRLRLIEGRLLGSWIFPTNPKGEVLIKYNQTGDLKLRLGQFKLNEDEELIKAEVFDSAEYPFTISDSPETFYSDAMDGSNSKANADYSTAHGAELGSVDDTGDYIYLNNSYDGASLYYIYRGALYFDTSALPDDADISATTLGLRSDYKAEADAGHGDVCIVEGLFDVANDGLAQADYALEKSTTRGSDTDYDYDTWAIDDYNTKSLNDTGIGWISLDSYTKFALRMKGDYDVSTPTGWNRVRIFMNEKGVGYQPKLVVTYTSGWSGEFCGVSVDEFCGVTPSEIDGV